MDLFWIGSKWPIESHGTGSRFTFVNGRVRSGQKCSLASREGKGRRREKIGEMVGE